MPCIDLRCMCRGLPAEVKFQGFSELVVDAEEVQRQLGVFKAALLAS